MQVSLVRPAWSVGILGASPTPVSWHIRQLVRPSNVCGTAVGVPVGAGVGAGAGVGLGAGAPPPQAASKGTRTSIAINAQNKYLFMASPP